MAFYSSVLYIYIGFWGICLDLFLFIFMSLFLILMFFFWGGVLGKAL